MIIVDMNLSPEWARILIAQGFESAHWRTLGSGSAEDREIFDYARRTGATILTQDLDFGVILAQTNEPRPSVVLLRLADVDPSHTAAFVIEALRTCAKELAAGAILSIDGDRHRVRLLPLRPEPTDS